jgi:hypothetical protein
MLSDALLLPMQNALSLLSTDAFEADFRSRYAKVSQSYRLFSKRKCSGVTSVLLLQRDHLIAATVDRNFLLITYDHEHHRGDV